MSFPDPTLHHSSSSDSINQRTLGWDAGPPMMTQEHEGQLPGLLRLMLTWHIWRRLKTLGEGILHEMTWLSVLPPGPRMIKKWFSGVTYPLGKRQDIGLERTSSSCMLRIPPHPFGYKTKVFHCRIFGKHRKVHRRNQSCPNPISQNNYILGYISFQVYIFFHLISFMFISKYCQNIK